MSLIADMKRLGLPRLLLFEAVYASIEREAIAKGDPRVGNPGGVADQLQAIREAIQELREEQGLAIPNVNVNVKTIVLKARRG
jgi:hypothetical protein